MQNKLRFKLIASLALPTATTAVFAHNGHGLDGSHWHATDAGSFVVLAVVVALAVWLSRRGK